eukprot:g18861.t1
MKCSLLTAGKAPHRVGNNACCRNDNDFFCTLLGSQQAVSAGLAVGGGEAVHNQPHAPGVGGLCTQEDRICVSYHFGGPFCARPYLIE